MPLPLLGNSTPSIKKGSDVNHWLWQFGRGRRRLGGLSVAANEALHIAVVKGAQRRP